jgi:hypothetical protein
VDWTITFLLTHFSTLHISSAELSDHLPHLALAFIFRFPCYYFRCSRFCLCMVCIEFTARSQTPVVSPKFSLMASDEAHEISAQPGENAANQAEESLVDQKVMASAEAASMHGNESDCESRFGDSGDNETASDNSGRLKVAVVAALAGISYDFGQSFATKTRLTSMESYARYFPKEYCHPRGAESMSKPRANEVVVFEDFFIAGLRMPPHLVLVDILHKFQVQLHQLTWNAIV